MISQYSRRVEVIVIYNGKDISLPLTESLLDFSYSDNPTGSLDDLQISVEDRQQLWQGDWMPTKGDTIKASIKTINWDGPNTFQTLPCGTFEVDAVDFNGPPDVVNIKSLSLPAGSGARREKRSRAWEKASLKTIAADIAKRAGLALVFDYSANPVYDRMEQTEQSDMAFLLDTCIKEGIAIKVTGGKLVLFDEAEYEQKAPVLTIDRGDGIISYSFSWSTTDAAYRACELTYTDSKTNKTIKVTYTPPGAPTTGPVLKINESASSQAEALRIAKQRLREQNKNYGKGSLALPGDPRLAAGVTITIKGWHQFDGKYIVKSASHAVGGSGYATSINIRKVLGW